LKTQHSESTLRFLLLMLMDLLLGLANYGSCTVRCYSNKFVNTFTVKSLRSLIEAYTDLY